MSILATVVSVLHSSLSLPVLSELFRAGPGECSPEFLIQHPKGAITPDFYHVYIYILIN